MLFGIRYKKVILTGDSCGGNLIIALTTMAIERGFRVPDGILPSYPNTIATSSIFWPSMMTALDDPILSVCLLVLVSKAITPDGEHKFIGLKNQYISPGLCASDETLTKFPPTRLVFAGICPLKDEGLYFFNRLLQNGVNATCKEFRLLPHAFLNFNLPIGRGMDEAKPAIYKCGDLIKELM